MDATAPPAGNLYLVVGYDGSPPAIRALDAAVRLLYGRGGSIEVVYVGHLPSIDMLSPGAVAEMEASFDDVARELHTAASEQLRDREERWRFERRDGLIPDELIAAAAGIRDAHPGDTVVIVVGSSSHAMHRVVGSVAVSLARRSAVPLVVVPLGLPGSVPVGPEDRPLHSRFFTQSSAIVTVPTPVSAVQPVRTALGRASGPDHRRVSDGSGPRRPGQRS